MLAGSPCQGFSFAGKQLAFDDPRSALFFEFIRLLKAIKPKYFLLENVRMKKEFLQVISEQVSECYPEITFGIEPIFINSSLLSAQSRQRYYWTNIPGIKQPEDKGIVLRDILETEPESFTTMSDSFVARQKKNIDGKCLVDHNKEKAASLSAMEYVKNGRQGDYLACDEKGVPQDKPSEFDKNLDKMTNKEGKAHCLTASYTGAVAWNSIEKRQRTMVPTNKPIQVNPSKKAGGKQPYIQDRVFHEDGKSHSLTASFADRTNVATKPIKVGMNVEEVKVRKHEVDIESLQYVLREMKKESGKTNKQIAAETKMPVTKVEHWFRTDSSFAIPGDDIWHRLKEILGIKSEVFDASIMEFEYRDGVFESTQRVYSDEGKSPTLTASNTEQMIETKPKQVGIAVDVNGHDQIKRVYSPDGKSPTVTTCGGGNREPKVITGGAIRGRAYDNKGKRMDRDGSSVANKTTQMLELRKDNKSNAITTVGKDSIVVENLPDKSQTIKSQYYKSSRANFERQGTFHATGVQSKDLTWRKLTPLECERLQTVPDNYTNHVSNTQRYKMLGNGWTIEVIKHIFKNMEHEVKDG
jgi:site-specific DNA-cytosine methylase